ncbi:hydrolase [Agaricicola taiwanensis]|uniref:Hydrolase n=1 Tax=Agaricicola taiwanensis TaxID=591372 RepID=A0A8J2YGB2_9RHOB|nr:isochorismatase family protein [Agaricicola taiwanensis]GGE37890.1 hydrolase [Agaricicola taiwanensis]
MTERVWDKYLTEKERAWLKTRPVRDFTLGKRAALIMIDLYRGGFGDKPEPLEVSLKTWPWSCGLNGWNALPSVVRLLETARAIKMPVIHINMRDPSDGLLGWIEARQKTGPGALTSSAADEDMRYRSTRIIDEVAPGPGEAVIAKAAPSAFWGTPLVAHLRQLDVDTLVVAGMTTSGCVRATVVDAAANRLNVVIPEECVFDRIEASHAISLFDMQSRFADVVPVQRVLEAMTGKVATAA